MDAIIEFLITHLDFVLGIIGGYLLNKLTSPRRRIVVYSTKNISTISIFSEIRPRVNIRFDDELVEDLSSIDYSIVNRGNVAIGKADVLEPFRFICPEGSRILHHEIVTSSSDYIEPTADLSGNSCSLSFSLLNPKDIIRLRLLCSNIGSNSIDVDGHINGIRKIKFNKAKRQDTALEQIKSFTLLAFMLTILSVAFFTLTVADIISYYNNADIFPTANYNSFTKYYLKDENNDSMRLAVRLGYLSKDPTSGVYYLNVDVVGPGYKAEHRDYAQRVLSQYQATIIEMKCSYLDSAALVSTYGYPDSILVRDLKLVGQHVSVIEAQRWCYTPMSFFQMFRKYIDMRMHYFITVFCLLLAVIFVTIKILYAGFRRFKLLSEEERKQVLNSMSFLAVPYQLYARIMLKKAEPAAVS